MWLSRTKLKLEVFGTQGHPGGKAYDCRQHDPRQFVMSLLRTKGVPGRATSLLAFVLHRHGRPMTQCLLPTREDQKRVFSSVAACAVLLAVVRCEQAMIVLEVIRHLAHP